MTSVGDFVILGDLALWKQKKNPVKFSFKVVIVFDIIQSLYAEFSKIKKKYNTLKPKKQTKTSWTVLTGKKKKDSGTTSISAEKTISNLTRQFLKTLRL